MHVLMQVPDWRTVRLTDEGRDFIERRQFDLAKADLAQYGDPRLKVLMGGDEIFPDEGLDFLHEVTFRRGATGSLFPDPAYLGLYVNGGAVVSPATVPARTAVLATQTGVTEASGGGYARAAIPSSSWPVPVTNGAGRRSTVASPGISFAESTGSYADPNVQGFFLATAVTGGKAIFYANFTSGQTVVVNQAGFVVRLPPFSQFDG